MITDHVRVEVTPNLAKDRVVERSPAFGTGDSSGHDQQGRDARTDDEVAHSRPSKHVRLSCQRVQCGLEIVYG
jgi:hypothetical protein